MRESRRIRYAVMIVAYRIDAGAISVPRLDHAIERPSLVVADGKARRAVPIDLLAGDVLQNCFGEPDVGKKRIPSLLACTLMPEAVACHFMPRDLDSPNDSGISLRNPPQSEECSVGVCVGEQFEEAIDVALVATRQCVP